MSRRPQTSKPTTTQPHASSEESLSTQTERLRLSVECVVHSVNSLLQASEKPETEARGEEVRDQYLALCQVAIALELPCPPHDLPSPFPERPSWLARASGIIDLSRAPRPPWLDWVFRLRRWRIEAEPLLKAKSSHAETTGMTWQDAAERMERLRNQAEPWTSQHKIAERLGCSSGTINKAIRETRELHSWAKRQTVATPRAQSINAVVTDSTAPSSVLNPADDIAIREYLEREDLSPDERAFFNSLSGEDQLEFLDDPDQHQRILGRKP
jgi:hypothetical protein